MRKEEQTLSLNFLSEFGIFPEKHNQVVIESVCSLQPNNKRLFK